MDDQAKSLLHDDVARCVVLRQRHVLVQKAF